MTILPELEHQLTKAAEAQSRGALTPSREERRRYRRLPARSVRTAVLVAVLLLVLVAAGLAATGVWNPPLGNGNGRPTRSDSPPPRRQLASLAVLRRPQTAADRGPISRAALRFFAKRTTAGVRTAYVRFLGRGDNGGGFVLVPVRRAGLDAPAIAKHLAPVERKLFLSRFNLKLDRLCLVALDKAPRGGFGGSMSCHPLSRIANGTTGESIGRRFYMLVPDEVARIRFRISGGTSKTAAAHNNLVTFRLKTTRRHTRGVIDSSPRQSVRSTSPRTIETPLLPLGRPFQTWYRKDGSIIGVIGRTPRRR
jgi:hypothetical protein